jgi:hypothetical protein
MSYYYVIVSKELLISKSLISLATTIKKNGGELMFSKKLCSVFSSLLIISCVCLLAGCFKNKVLVKVKKDGSGTIVVTQIFSSKVVKINNAQSKVGGRTKSNLINKNQIEFAAKSFGTNVKFKKMKELNKPDGSEGYIALYTFDNIKDVKIPIGPMGASRKSIKFEYEENKGGINKLTVNLDKIENLTASKDDKKEYPPHPQSPQDIQGIKGMKALADNPFNFSDKDSKEDMIKKMLADMSYSVSIETVGKIVKSNALYPSKKKPSRFTVVDVNFNKLMKSKKFLYDLAEAGNRMSQELLSIMSTCPEGFKYDKQGEIVVEFK